MFRKLALPLAFLALSTPVASASESQVQRAFNKCINDAATYVSYHSGGYDTDKVVNTATELCGKEYVQMVVKYGDAATAKQAEYAFTQAYRNYQAAKGAAAIIMSR